MAVGTNITGINSPEADDTTYVAKIIVSFTAVDDHDHSSGKGLAVARLAAAAADASTLEVSSGKMRIKDAGVTRAKMAALGQQLSSSSGAFTTTSTLLVDITNLEVTITTTGRPVFIGLLNGGTTVLTSGIDISKTSAASAEAIIVLLRDGVAITSFTTRIVSQTGSGGTVENLYPCSSFWHIDTPVAGTYVYKMQAAIVTGSQLSVIRARLVAYEIG